MAWLKDKLGRTLRGQEKAAGEEESKRVYDWIDHSPVGVIEKEVREESGEGVQYVIRHPMGNVIAYPQTQVSITEGRCFLYPYSVSNAIRLSEALKETLSKCEELVRLRSKMNIDEETYRESIKKIFDQEKIIERYRTTASDLDTFAKRIDVEIQRMMVEAQEARSSNVFGDLSDEEFARTSELMKERVKTVRTIKTFIDELRDQISASYQRLTELGYSIQEEVGEAGETATKRRTFRLRM